MALKESVAITLSADLAVGYLGDRVATIVVKMMKRKLATSEFSNFGCAIPVLLAMLHRIVLWNLDVLSSLFSSKIWEILRGGLKIFSRSHRSSLSIIIIGYQ